MTCITKQIIWEEISKESLHSMISILTEFEDIYKKYSINYNESFNIKIKSINFEVQKENLMMFSLFFYWILALFIIKLRNNLVIANAIINNKMLIMLKAL